MQPSTHNFVWAGFLDAAQPRLRARGLSPGTVAIYTSSLRAFAHHTACMPGCVTAADIKAYLYALADQHASATWIATTITACRTVFDGLLGQSVTVGCSTPKRPDRLPEILSVKDARAILQAGRSLRDQLLMGLLYGCGLKVGEAVGLRWRDVDTSRHLVHAPGDRMTHPRDISIPEALRPLLGEGQQHCPPDGYIFAGADHARHLTTRTAENIVRRAAHASGVLKVVSCKTLRHAFGIHMLERGNHARKVQVLMGHRSIRTTMRYQRCMMAPDPLAPSPSPAAVLFEKPLSAESMAPPFVNGSESRAGSWFRRILRTMLGRAFLSLRTRPPPFGHRVPDG